MQIVTVTLTIQYQADNMSLVEIMDDVMEIRCSGTRHGHVSGFVLSMPGTTIDMWGRDE